MSGDPSTKVLSYSTSLPIKRSGRSRFCMLKAFWSDVVEEGVGQRRGELTTAVFGRRSSISSTLLSLANGLVS